MGIAATAKRILSILRPKNLATQFRKLTGMAEREVVSASHSGLTKLEHANPLDFAREHSLRTEAELAGRPIARDAIPLSEMTPLDVAREHSLRTDAELTGRPIVRDPKPISQMSPLEFAQQHSLRTEAELAESRANLFPPAMPADGIRSAAPAIAKSGKNVGG